MNIDASQIFTVALAGLAAIAAIPALVVLIFSTWQASLVTFIVVFGLLLLGMWVLSHFN